MKILEKKLTEIEPYERNPRKNDAAVEYVANSIKEFGFKVPIVVDKDGVIIAGHTRYKAARKLHLDTVPVLYADDLNDEQVKAFRLADNKVSEKADWDNDLLAFELADLEMLDMTDFGFDFGDMEEDDVKPKEPKDLSDEVGGFYQVVVECEDEAAQEETFNKLTGEGYICRVLTL